MKAGLLLPALLLTFLSSCNTSPPMSREMFEALAGVWRQVDGPSSLHFYRDGTVLVRLPDRRPPLKFVSTFELLKDGRIGIASGDVWLGPISIEWKPGSRRMRATVPDRENRPMILQKSG